MSTTSKDDPAVRRASAFEALRVSDAMHQPARTCGPEASLVSVAHTLAAHHIHAVVVEGLGEDAGDSPWGIVSALDVSHAAAHPRDHRTAADTAATEVVTVSPDEPLPRAAQVMAEHELTHLVVVESPDGRPVGILSTLDIARAYADPEHSA
jgi:CBS domain-containing protein